MRTLEVRTPGMQYEIFIGAGLLDREQAIPVDAERIVVVVDERLANLAKRVRGTTTYVVPSGERSKSIDEALKLWRSLASHGFHRNDLIVAIGGGVVGDLAGFVAATYHRGMDWVVVPTTLLAMVDSSIGGKTAIDLPEGKNLVGAFHQPKAVVADVSLLTTLPHDAFATGMAEVVKHGFIDDLSLLERLERDKARIESRDAQALEELVHQAAAVKVRVVNEDVTERGARAFLNYGHTLGHALEALGGYTRWTHGHAISIGMMFAAHLAPALGFADRIDAHRAALVAQGLPVTGAHFPYEDVASMFLRDKKYDAGIRFVVLEDFGKPRVVREVPEDALRAAYEKVR